MEGIPHERWETVHSVNDYYDCPRNGVADYQGALHAYQCDWDHEADDWSRVFLLSPISVEQFEVVKEDWAIWQRWLTRHLTQTLEAEDKHFVLAIDRLRNEELRPVIEKILSVDEAHAIRAIPAFRRLVDRT